MAKDGILVAMHPSSFDEENPRYAQKVLSHSYPVPTQVTFIDKFGPLAEPIDELAKAGCDNIVLVPLYPSVLNTEVRAFFYRLGICVSPMPYYSDSQVVDPRLPIRIGQPFGGDRLLGQMHLDLGLSQSKKPENEAYLLLYHGNLPGFATPPEDNQLFDSLVESIRDQSPFATVQSAHVYPRSNITATAKGLAEKYDRVVTVPYFVGASRFTTRILPRYLAKAERDNISWTGETLLDHPRLGEYIVRKYREVVDGGIDRTAEIAAMPPEREAPVPA